MADTRTPVQTPPEAGSLRWLYAGALSIIIVLVVSMTVIVLNLRESALQSSERSLTNISIALAEQANRAIQGLDLVLTSLNEFLLVEGVVDGASYEQKMSEQRIHVLLKEKLTGLPYINAVTMINPDGKLINFSRFWPIPAVNIADRDYFKAIKADPKLHSFISAPVPNRGDGTWTVYLARRVHTRNGEFAGLLLGAIELRYFEELYRTVSLGAESAISLLREDGMLLARHPPTAKIGATFADGGQRVAPRVGTGTVREPSPVDGAMRIKAAHRLVNFPLVVLATQTETEALRGWSGVTWVLGLITGGCVIAVLVAAFAMGNWWRQQQRAGQERADLAQAEAELARSRERVAEESNRAKSGFLAMMSHEIRTPMNAVLGLAGTLLDGTLAPPQQKIVEAIRDSGDSLLRILNDILDYSKLDAGQMTLETAPFSPAALAHNAVSIMGPRAIAKGLRIEATADPGLPPALNGDAGRIRQILLNLVSNAVKFTAAGHVTVGARRIPGGNAGDMALVEWEVSDTGIGIPADQLGALFGEFMQADSSITRRFGGSGLGLAISKRLAEQMGGTITIDSETDRGTILRLRLTLPMVAEVVPPHEPVTDPAVEFRAALTQLGRPMRVLFAEDNPTNQFVALQMLKGFDVHIDLVGNGVEAIDAASRFTYDAICMDVRMPEMDGLTATRAIRSMAARVARIPIIALTANAFAEDVQACMDAGMDQFIAKPISRNLLLAALMQALPDHAEAKPAALAAGGAAMEAVDSTALAYLQEAIGADGLAELLEIFTQETQARLSDLGSRSGKTLLRELHSLNGAAMTAGAPALAAAAAEMEVRLHAGDTLTAADRAVLATAFNAWQIHVAARAPTEPQTRLG